VHNFSDYLNPFVYCYSAVYCDYRMDIYRAAQNRELWSKVTRRPMGLRKWITIYQYHCNFSCLLNCDVYKYTYSLTCMSQKQFQLHYFSFVLMTQTFYSILCYSSDGGHSITLPHHYWRLKQMDNILAVHDCYFIESEENFCSFLFNALSLLNRE